MSSRRAFRLMGCLMVFLHRCREDGWRVTFLMRQRLGLRHGQEAGRPAPCRSRTVRDRLPSYGSSVQVALVIGTMTGSVYALLEPEDKPLNLLPRLVLPRLSMPLGICHSDEAPTGSYTLDLTGSASAYPWHYPGPWLLGPSCTRQACG